VTIGAEVKLTVYLAEEDVDDFDEVIRDSYLEGEVRTKYESSLRETRTCLSTAIAAQKPTVRR